MFQRHGLKVNKLRDLNPPAVVHDIPPFEEKDAPLDMLGFNLSGKIIRMELTDANFDEARAAFSDMVSEMYLKTFLRQKDLEGRRFEDRQIKVDGHIRTPDFISGDVIWEFKTTLRAITKEEEATIKSAMTVKYRQDSYRVETVIIELRQSWARDMGWGVNAQRLFRIQMEMFSSWTGKRLSGFEKKHTARRKPWMGALQEVGGFSPLGPTPNYQNIVGSKHETKQTIAQLTEGFEPFFNANYMAQSNTIDTILKSTEIPPNVDHSRPWSREASESMYSCKPGMKAKYLVHWPIDKIVAKDSEVRVDDAIRQVFGALDGDREGSYHKKLAQVILAKEAIREEVQELEELTQERGYLLSGSAKDWADTKEERAKRLVVTEARSAELDRIATEKTHGLHTKRSSFKPKFTESDNTVLGLGAGKKRSERPNRASLPLKDYNLKRVFDRFETSTKNCGDWSGSYGNLPISKHADKLAKASKEVVDSVLQTQTAWYLDKVAKAETGLEMLFSNRSGKVCKPRECRAFKMEGQPTYVVASPGGETSTGFIVTYTVLEGTEDLPEWMVPHTYYNFKKVTEVWDPDAFAEGEMDLHYPPLSNNTARKRKLTRKPLPLKRGSGTGPIPDKEMAPSRPPVEDPEHVKKGRWVKVEKQYRLAVSKPFRLQTSIVRHREEINMAWLCTAIQSKEMGSMLHESPLWNSMWLSYVRMLNFVSEIVYLSYKNGMNNGSLGAKGYLKKFKGLVVDDVRVATMLHNLKDGYREYCDQTQKRVLNKRKMDVDDPIFKVKHPNFQSLSMVMYFKNLFLKIDGIDEAFVASQHLANEMEFEEMYNKSSFRWGSRDEDAVMSVQDWLGETVQGEDWTPVSYHPDTCYWATYMMAKESKDSKVILNSGSNFRDKPLLKTSKKSKVYVYINEGVGKYTRIKVPSIAELSTRTPFDDALEEYKRLVVAETATEDDDLGVKEGDSVQKIVSSLAEAGTESWDKKFRKKSGMVNSSKKGRSVAKEYPGVQSSELSDALLDCVYAFRQWVKQDDCPFHYLEEDPHFESYETSLADMVVMHWAVDPIANIVTSRLKAQKGYGKRIFFIQTIDGRNTRKFVDESFQSLLESVEEDMIHASGDEKNYILEQKMYKLGLRSDVGIMGTEDQTKYGDLYDLKAFKPMLYALRDVGYFTSEEAGFIWEVVKRVGKRYLLFPEYLKRMLEAEDALLKSRDADTPDNKRFWERFDKFKELSTGHIAEVLKAYCDPELKGRVPSALRNNLFLHRSVGFILGVFNKMGSVLSSCQLWLQKKMLDDLGLGKICDGATHSDDSVKLTTLPPCGNQNLSEINIKQIIDDVKDGVDIYLDSEFKPGKPARSGQRATQKRSKVVKVLGARPDGSLIQYRLGSPKMAKLYAIMSLYVCRLIGQRPSTEKWGIGASAEVTQIFLMSGRAIPPIVRYVATMGAELPGISPASDLMMCTSRVFQIAASGGSSLLISSLMIACNLFVERRYGNYVADTIPLRVYPELGGRAWFHPVFMSTTGFASNDLRLLALAYSGDSYVGNQLKCLMDTQETYRANDDLKMMYGGQLSDEEGAIATGAQSDFVVCGRKDFTIKYYWTTMSKHQLGAHFRKHGDRLKGMLTEELLTRYSETHKERIKKTMKTHKRAFITNASDLVADKMLFSSGEERVQILKILKKYTGSSFQQRELDIPPGKAIQNRLGYYNRLYKNTLQERFSQMLVLTDESFRYHEWRDRVLEYCLQVEDVDVNRNKLLIAYAANQTNINSVLVTDIIYDADIYDNWAEEGDIFWRRIRVGAPSLFPGLKVNMGLAAYIQSGRTNTEISLTPAAKAGLTGKRYYEEVTMLKALEKFLTSQGVTADNVASNPEFYSGLLRDRSHPVYFRTAVDGDYAQTLVTANYASREWRTGYIIRDAPVAIPPIQSATVYRKARAIELSFLCLTGTSALSRGVDLSNIILKAGPETATLTDMSEDLFNATRDGVATREWANARLTAFKGVTYSRGSSILTFYYHPGSATGLLPVGGMEWQGNFLFLTGKRGAMTIVTNIADPSVVVANAYMVDYYLRVKPGNERFSVDDLFEAPGKEHLSQPWRMFGNMLSDSSTGNISAYFTRREVAANMFPTMSRTSFDWRTGSWVFSDSNYRVNVWRMSTELSNYAVESETGAALVNDSREEEEMVFYAWRVPKRGGGIGVLETREMIAFAEAINPFLAVRGEPSPVGSTAVFQIEQLINYSGISIEDVVKIGYVYDIYGGFPTETVEDLGDVSDIHNVVWFLSRFTDNEGYIVDNITEAKAMGARGLLGVIRRLKENPHMFMRPLINSDGAPLQLLAAKMALVDGRFARHRDWHSLKPHIVGPTHITEGMVHNLGRFW